jgi:hypothetical protein
MDVIRLPVTNKRKTDKGESNLTLLVERIVDLTKDVEALKQQAKTDRLHINLLIKALKKRELL